MDDGETASKFTWYLADSFSKVLGHLLQRATLQQLNKDFEGWYFTLDSTMTQVESFFKKGTKDELTKELREIRRILFADNDPRKKDEKMNKALPLLRSCHSNLWHKIDKEVMSLAPKGFDKGTAIERVE